MVLFELPATADGLSPGTSVGRVSFVEASGTIDIDELACEDASAGLWVEGGQSYSVQASAVQRVLEYDYGQRMEQDRVANPHGEHAEEIWQLLEAVPEEAVRLETGH